MKGKGKIKRVICPYCGKEMFKHRGEAQISQGIAFWSNSRYIGTPARWDFRCYDCVYIFQEGWFDWMDTFEHLVLREGEDIDEWRKGLKYDKK